MAIIYKNIIDRRMLIYMKS